MDRPHWHWLSLILLSLVASGCRSSGERTEARDPKVKDYVVRKARAPITLDGRADEPDWQGAAKSPAFITAAQGPKVDGTAVAKLLWDEDNLYAFIEVRDADMQSPHTQHDDPLWKQDVVELFIDADRNGEGYVELQVSPRNVHFDAWFPKTRAQRHHFEWSSQMKSAVAANGTLDDASDRDTGYSVEIAIPHQAVRGMESAMNVHTPPALGDKWRLNVVRVDKAHDKNITASSWNQIPIQDFHALDHMLTVVFADPHGALPVTGAP